MLLDPGLSLTEKSVYHSPTVSGTDHVLSCRKAHFLPSSTLLRTGDCVFEEMEV